MNADLVEIKEEIERRNALQEVKNPAPLHPIDFGIKAEKKGEMRPPDKAGELVDEAFNQAIVAQVQNNEELQKELLGSADTVIHSKVNAIKAKADQEDKETHFNNKKGACDCYGFNETTTPKWAVNFMNFFHNVFIVIWIIVGSFTFAPIVFVGKKIGVIVSRTWVAMVLAFVIYILIVATPVVINLLK